MRPTIKFMMALGNVKLLMLDGANGNDFYAAVNPSVHHKRTASVKRIVSCLNATK